MSIEVTQEKIGAIIKKPKLTENLLNRPPFRFLHDVITNVIKATGFASDIYTEDEMSSENIKDKKAKIAYLEKIMGVVAAKVGQDIPAKPAKIVAGLEAENTNVFLQMLADAATGKSSGSAKPKEEKSEKKKKKKKEKEPEPEPEPAKEEPKAEDGKKKKKKKKEKEKEPEPEPEPEPAKEEPKADDGKKKKKKKKDKEKEKEKEPEPEPEPAKEKKQKDPEPEPEPEPEPDRAVSRASKASAQPSGEDERVTLEPSTNKRPARPMSARPAPPKVKTNVKTVVKKNEIPDKADLEAESKVKNTIIEDNKMDDDEEDFLVEEAPPTQDPTEGLEDDGQHGKLVRDMLEAKKAAEQKVEDDRKAAGSQQTQGGGIIIQRQAKKEAVTFQKELEKIRENLQTLVRSANPLGRTMDYMQEDLDSMVKELDMWKGEATIQESSLEDEKKATERALQPLYDSLKDMDRQIHDQIDKINGMKSIILKNEQQIAKSLRMVVTK